MARIAEELGVRESQVARRWSCSTAGPTVPFIARYRKEVDRQPGRRAAAHARGAAALPARAGGAAGGDPGVDPSQGKLDDALEAQILAADTKARLEDIYLPYKPKRRTKAQIAREAGLEPLADWPARPTRADPQRGGRGYVDAERGVADVAAALDGARAILVERFAEDADLIGELRERMWTRGPARLAGARGQGGRRAPSSPTTSTSPSRSPSCPRTGSWPCSAGEKEEILDLTMDPRTPADGAAAVGPSDYERAIAAPLRHRRPGPPGGPVAARHRALGLAHPDPASHLGIDLRMRLRQAAEDEAVARVRRQPARPAAGRARPAPAPRWAWTRASAPASRSRWSTPPARWSPPTRSTRTSRAGRLGRVARPRWPGWPRRTASS